MKTKAVIAGAVLIAIIAAAIYAAWFWRPAAQPTVTKPIILLATDKEVYNPGDVVVIKGSVKGIPDETHLGIEVRGPENILIWVDEVKVVQGAFQSKFQLHPEAPQGEYKVYVAGGGCFNNTSFKVQAGG